MAPKPKRHGKKRDPAERKRKKTSKCKVNRCANTLKAELWDKFQEGVSKKEMKDMMCSLEMRVHGLKWMRAESADVSPCLGVIMVTDYM